MGIARAGAKSPADLSGSLPVPDYLDSLYDCFDPRYFGRDGLWKPRNEWLESDTKAYAAVLMRGKYSLLVVPVQTQFYGFDQIERSLLSAEIAEAFSTQGAIPSTLLVARALGEVRRRFDPGAADLLASALGVSRVLYVYAGHDGKHRMTLSMYLQQCEKPQTCSIPKRHDWRGIAFSDEQPPFLAVRAMRNTLVHDLLGASVAVAPRPAPRANVTSALNLSMLGKAPTTGDPAAVATVIAALAPGADELGRDRLHVLALREALDAMPSAVNRVRAAHAAYRLNRRPLALKLLEGQHDPAANTLRELLNGNVIEAQSALPMVDAPDLKLALSFDVQDLAALYHRPATFDASLAQRVFGSKSSAWTAVVARRADDADGWGPTDALTPKRLLDDVFPITGQDVASVAKGLRAVGRDSDPDLSFAKASLRHLQLARSKLDPAECCSATRGNPTWSIYWLTESILESNALDSVSHRLFAQSVPESAATLLDEYREYYSGQPDFEVLRFHTGAELSRRASNEMARRLMTEAEVSEASAAYWSQGQSLAGQSSVLRGSTTMFIRKAYTQDFPKRAAWPPADEAEAAAVCDALAYVTTELMPAAVCLSTAGPGDLAARQADVARRFHGNPDAAPMLKAYLPKSPSADPAADLRASIAADPETWDNYRDLGLLLLKRDANYTEAQKVYLAYPEFKRREHSQPVRVSNAAYEVGSELFWRGRFDLARPLYQLAADLDTGSSASMTSVIRLALIDGDYESAAEGSLERGLRYPNPYAYRDYLSLLFTLGHGDDARAGFAQIAGNFDDASAWAAMLVGQRMQSMSPPQFKTWILSDEIRSARYRGRHYAPIYALWWMTTDRKPAADFGQIMRSIEADEKRTMEGDGISLTRPHPTIERGFEMVRPSALRRSKTTHLAPDSTGPSEYVLLADAMSAYHAGNFDAAVTRFTALADRYPIEQGDMMAALGYFAHAAAKTGDKIGLEEFLPRIAAADDSFDVWLARAFFAAGRRDAETAYRALVRAFNVRPHTESRPIMTEYQFAEACEIVFQETGDPRLVPLMLDWAKAWQRIHPMSAWAYAIEAQYSKIPADVTRALGMTLYLDPQSPRIAKFDAAKIAAARAWLKANNPFLVSKALPDTRPST